MTQDTGEKEAANKFLVLFNNCKLIILRSAILD